MAKLNTTEFVKNLEAMAIAMTAQGHETSVKPIDYPAITVTGWLIYGARRWYQDHVNSVALGHRTNNEKFSGVDLFAARDKMAKAGEWGSRGTGSGLDPQIVQMLNGKLSKSVDGWSKLKIGKQTEARVDLWATFDESKKAKWNAKATVIKAIKAKAIAEIKALDDKDVPVDLDD